MVVVDGGAVGRMAAATGDGNAMMVRLLPLSRVAARCGLLLCFTLHAVAEIGVVATAFDATTLVLSCELELN